MVHVVVVSLALVAMTTIPGAHSYGATGGVYQQIATALWQLQMKGDMNKALQHTEIWTRPTPSLRPGGGPRDQVRPGGLVVRPIDINERLPIPPQSHLNTPDPSKFPRQPAGNFPMIRVRPSGLEVRPIHVEERLISPPQLPVQPIAVIRPTQGLGITDTAFARRATQRQVTEPPKKEIDPQRIYSNKMDRDTAKGYGSSLTKLIAKKLKFNPTPEPDRPSHPIIDSVLGPVAQNGGSPVLPGNFVPRPSTPIVPQRAPNTPTTKVRMGVNIQRPEVVVPVENMPVIVLKQDRQPDLPSPSFSVVAPARGQQPSSFRFSNKEVNSNQLQDKNAKGESSGIENFKDLEINDASQVIIDQPTLLTAKPIVVKEQVVIKKQDVNVDEIRVETTIGKKPQQTGQTLPVSTKPEQAPVETQPIESKKSMVSRSDVPITGTPTKPQGLWREATVTRKELKRPEIEVVQPGPILTLPGEEVYTSTQAPVSDQTVGTPTDTPIESIDFTTTEPTSTMWTTSTSTTTTAQPVRVGISRGSPRGRRPESSSGSFRGIRPSSRGRRPSSRGLSPVSRGPSRGVRPVGVRLQKPVASTPENIPEMTPPTFTSFTAESTTTLSPTTRRVGTEATTRQLAPQVPAMNTAQFARRARPGRVVVSTTNNQNSQSTDKPPVVSRGVGQRNVPVRAMGAVSVPVRAMEPVPVPSDRLSFDRSVAGETPILESVRLNAAGPAETNTSPSVASQPTTPMITATEQPPPPPTTTTTSTTTRRPRTFRQPGMMSPEEKRQAQRNFQG